MIPDERAIADSIVDPAAFAVVFDRHFDAISNYLQRRLGPDLAEDLAAQTFLIAFDQRARFDPGRSDARPWLFGIATNLLRRQRRQELRQLRAYARSGVDPVLDAFEGLEARLDAANRGAELAAALAGLVSDELDVLLLYAWAELSDGEIAQALDIPLGTVRSRLSRARGRVRELLDADRASTGATQPLRTQTDHG